MSAQLTIDQFEIWDGRDFQPAKQVIVSMGFDPVITVVAVEGEDLIFTQEGGCPNSFRTTSWHPLKVR